MTVWEVTLGLAFFFVLYLGALAIYELITIIDGGGTGGAQKCVTSINFR